HAPNPRPEHPDPGWASTPRQRRSPWPSATERSRRGCSGALVLTALAGFAVQRVPPVPPAVLHELDPVAIVLPVLDRGVVPVPALGAGQRDLRSVVGLRHLVLFPRTARRGLRPTASSLVAGG